MGRIYTKNDNSKTQVFLVYFITHHPLKPVIFYTTLKARFAFKINCLLLKTERFSTL
jgi:hypothetical protein